MENGHRINKFSSTPRLVNINSGVQFTLEGKKISGFESDYKDSTPENDYDPEENDSGPPTEK